MGDNAGLTQTNAIFDLIAQSIEFFSPKLNSYFFVMSSNKNGNVVVDVKCEQTENVQKAESNAADSSEIGFIASGAVLIVLCLIVLFGSYKFRKMRKVVKQVSEVLDQSAMTMSNPMVIVCGISLYADPKKIKKREFTDGTVENLLGLENDVFHLDTLFRQRLQYQCF